MATTLTGIQDIDISILNILDEYELSNACQTDKYINSLCQLDSLWQRRFPVQYNIPTPVEKIDELSWRDYYYLYTYLPLEDEDLQRIVENGVPSVIRSLLNNYPWVVSEVIRLIINNSDEELFRWLVDVYGYQLGVEDANIVASEGSVDFLEIIAEYDIYPDATGIGLASDNGHVGVLEWLLDNEIVDEEDLQEYADEAMITGPAESIVWFLEHRIIPSSEAIIEGVVRLVGVDARFYNNDTPSLIVDELRNSGALDEDIIDKIFHQGDYLGRLISVGLQPSGEYMEDLRNNDPNLYRNIRSHLRRR